MEKKVQVPYDSTVETCSLELPFQQKQMPVPSTQYFLSIAV